MEMDLRTSGALSRSHFALVQQVENAPSPQEIDVVIRKEISGIRARLQKTSTTSRETAECLILLLYCQSVAPYPVKTKSKFALSHAVKLAEGGDSLRDRRIAYQYCIQNLPSNHDLHLMLVNTLRKDLTSSTRPRIALGLDYITQSPGPEVIPAIQDRLRELISHKSLDIQRRALLAVRSLSKVDSYLVASLRPELLALSTDAELSRASVALDIVAGSEQNIVEYLLRRLDYPHQSYSQPIVTILETLSRVLKSAPDDSISSRVINSLITLLHGLQPQRTFEAAVFKSAFVCISHLSPAAVVDTIVQAPSASPLIYLRPLLHPSISDPNTRYLAMQCLHLLDPSLWTGLSATTDMTDICRKALTIEESEVGCIMGFMDSKDSSLRKLTFKVLNKVDSNILKMYRDQLLAAISSPPPITRSRPRSRSSSVSAAASASPLENPHDDLQRKLLLVMEIFDVVSCRGDMYAEDLKRLLAITGSAPPGSPVASPRSSLAVGKSATVLEAVVEKTLSFLDTAPQEDQKLFIDTFINDSPAGTGVKIDSINQMASTSDIFLSRDAFSTKSTYGPTGLTILAATACAYGNLADISPEELLKKLDGHLSGSQPAVQETLLLSITKSMAWCRKGVPSEVLHDVEILQRLSGRHIRMRCQQVLDYSKRPDELSQIVQSANSSSLPDFLMALESKKVAPVSSVNTSPSPSHIISSLPPSSPPFATSPMTSPRFSANKLRYEAYEAPKLALPRSVYRDKARSSSIPSSPGAMRSPRKLDDRYEDDGMSNTATAGELALAGESKVWRQTDHRLRSNGDTRQALTTKPENDTIEKFELITLSSPFQAEAQLAAEDAITTNLIPTSPAHHEFESFWELLAPIKSGAARGWCSSPPSAVEGILRTSAPQYLFIVAPDTHNPFIEDVATGNGTICALLRRRDRPDYVAAIKLKPGDDGSCMWMLRSQDAETRVAIKEALD